MIGTGFKCSKCKRAVDIEKDLTIYRFPKILVIHLKRFYHSAMRREKLNTTVQFPETLDVSAFAPHSSKSVEAVLSPCSHSFLLVLYAAQTTIVSAKRKATSCTA